MKLRIKNNSIRFRLTQTDVSHLNIYGNLTESVNFGDSALSFSVVSVEGNTLCTNFANNKITLLMPRQMITELAETDRVGFDGKENGLYLLVEKDFTCLENVDEDQSDNYPNPALEHYHQERIEPQ